MFELFEFDLSDDFRKSLEKLSKKDKKLSLEFNNKIKEIISRDSEIVDFYKNLRGNMSEFKRVHVRNWFVVIFKVYKKENLIRFIKLGHRKDAYKEPY